MARPISQSRLGSLHSKSACSLSQRRFAARNGFERYAEYMTKPDEFMRLALPGYRCMGKGQLGLLPAGHRSGRPRSAENGVSQWVSASYSPIDIR